MPAHVRALTWRRWWIDAAVRAFQVGAVAAVSAIGTEALLRAVDWVVVAEIAALAVVLSLLSSLTELPATDAARRRPDAHILPVDPPRVPDDDDR